MIQLVIGCIKGIPAKIKKIPNSYAGFYEDHRDYGRVMKADF